MVEERMGKEGEGEHRKVFDDTGSQHLFSTLLAYSSSSNPIKIIWMRGINSVIEYAAASLLLLLLALRIEPGSLALT